MRPQLDRPNGSADPFPLGRQHRIGGHERVEQLLGVGLVVRARAVGLELRSVVIPAQPELASSCDQGVSHLRCREARVHRKRSALSG